MLCSSMYVSEPLEVVLPLRLYRVCLRILLIVQSFRISVGATVNAD